LSVRFVLLTLVAALLVFGTNLAVSAQPAPPAHVIKVSMTSYKYDPDILTFNAGEKVVLQLSNDDPENRAHSLGSPYWSAVKFTITGDAKQGVAKDGWTYIQLDAGKKTEITFVAAGRGQYDFLCELYNHASRGQTGQIIVLNK